MRLPTTTAPYMFLMSPGQKYVAFNSSLSVTSAVERISGKVISAPTAAAQPTWSGTALAGTYVNANLPGATGISGMIYGGTQSLEFDNLATPLDGYVDFTFTTVVSCTDPSGSTAQTVWSLGTSTSTSSIALQYVSNNLRLREVNSNGTFTASTSTDAGIHVVTCSRIAGTLTLRVDGVQVATASVTPAGPTYDRFCIGALNTNNSVTLNLTGKIGVMAAWLGSADVQRTEAVLMLDVGLIRGSILS